MNNFEQVRDVLKHLEMLHGRIKDLYADLGNTAKSERVRMLLNLLCQHEDGFQYSISTHIQQASPTSLDTYFQYSHETNINALFNVDNVDASLNADDIEKISTRFSDYLDGFYKDLIQVAEISEVKELFENLRQQQMQERKRLSTDIYSLLDM